MCSSPRNFQIPTQDNNHTVIANPLLTDPLVPTIMQQFDSMEININWLCNDCFHENKDSDCVCRQCGLYYDAIILPP